MPQILIDGVIRDMTPEEIEILNNDENYIKAEIMGLKETLNTSDYKIIKFLENLIADIGFKDIKQERQKARDKINELEEKLKEVLGVSEDGGNN